MALFYNGLVKNIYWLNPELIGPSARLALYNVDQRYSGETPCDLSLDENSPYFVPAATWDRTGSLWYAEWYQRFYPFSHRGG